MKNILSLMIVVIMIFVSTLTTYGKTEIEYPYERYKLELTKEELAFIKELQQKTIDVASYSKSKSNIFMLKDIEKTFGLKFNYIEFNNFGRALKSVENGKTKLISQITYTNERQKVLAFSRATVLTKAHIFTYDARIFDHIDTATIGVESGTTWANYISRNYPGVKTVNYDTFDEALELMNNNIVNGVIDSDKSYYDFVNMGMYPVEIYDKLDISATSLAGTKDEMELFLSAYSKYSRTEEFAKNVNGFFDEYYKNVNRDYLDKLLEKSNINKTIKVAIPILPPFSDTSRNNKIGIFPDLFDKTMKSAGLKYEIVEVEDNSLYTAKKMLLNGEVDITFPAIEYIDYSGDIIFSETSYDDKSIIVRRKNYDKKIFNNIHDLAQEKIGIVEGSPFVDFFENAFPTKKFIFYKNEFELIEGLKNGQVDIIPIYERTFLEYINGTKEFFMEKVETIDNFIDIKFSIAAKNTENDRALMDIINVAYRTIDNQKIKSSYYNPVDYEVYYNTQKKIFELIVFALVAMLIVSFLLVLNLRKSLKTDSLCKTLNRKALIKDYANGIKENETVIIFDINNFKGFNELYGHSVGDEILKSFVNSYKGEEKFKMYRIGGDEFVVIDDFSRKNISINEYVDSFLFQNIYLNIANTEVHITASIGILPGKYGIKNLEESLSIVEIAMYESKKIQVSKTFINKVKLDEYSKKIEFRNQLKLAIKNKDIYCEYQPIFSLDTNKVIGAEVFSRWTLNGVLVPTNTYMEFANILGLEAEIDLISLDYAGRLYKKLKEENILPDNFKIHVNISDISIINFAQNSYKLLDTCIPIEMLVLEVKEKYLNNVRCTENIQKILNSGFNVEIDNFLSESYCSRNFNNQGLSNIKIEGSILRDMPKDKLFLKAQVDMLHTLEKSLSVQILESKWQLTFFKNLNIKKGQGYYLCKPLDLESVTLYIKNDYTI